MVEVSEEFIETMHGRQVIVAITLVVLAELTGGVSSGLQNGGDGYVTFLPALFCSWQTHFGHPSAYWYVPAEECSASCGATLLTVVVSKRQAFFGDAVDVRGAISHHPAVVVTDIPSTDVITPDHEDIGFLLLCLSINAQAGQ